MRTSDHENQPQISLDELIPRALSGDQSACGAIYQRLAGPTYRLAYGILLSAQDAEEVVQDSFAYAFHNLDQFDPNKSAFRTWLYTITMSRCRNKRRRKWLPTINIHEIADRIPGREPSPDAIVERSGMKDLVLTALKELTPKLREAIVLRYFEGLTYREMAEVLHCPQKTAESRVRLAHEALYTILSEEHGIPSLEALLSR